MTALPNRPIVEGRLSLGGFYDTNVSEQGRGTRLAAGLNRRDDFSTRLKADVGGALPLSEFRPESEQSVLNNLLLGGGVTLAPTWQSHDDELDTANYAGRVFINWLTTDRLRIGVQYDFDYGDLDRQRYLTSQRVSPVITYAWWRSPQCDPMSVDEHNYRRDCDRDQPPSSTNQLLTVDRLYTDVYYTWGDFDFSEPLTDSVLARDGQRHVIGVRNTWLMVRDIDLYAHIPEGWPGDRYSKEAPPRLSPDEWVSWSVGYEFDRSDTHGSEYDGRNHVLTSDVHLPLPFRTWSFDFRSKFSWEDYGEPSIFSGSGNNRSDFVQHYLFGLTWVNAARNPDCDPFAACLKSFDFRDWEVRVTSGVGLTFADSNVVRSGASVFEYDRAVFGVQVELRMRATRQDEGHRAIGGTALITGGRGLGPPPVKPVITLPPIRTAPTVNSAPAR